MPYLHDTYYFLCLNIFIYESPRIKNKVEFCVYIKMIQRKKIIHIIWKSQVLPILIKWYDSVTFKILGTQGRENHGYPKSPSKLFALVCYTD